MLKDQPWIKYAPDMYNEWEQCLWEGKDVGQFKEQCAEIVKNRDEEKAEIMANILFNAPVRGDFTFVEPSDWEGIQKEKPTASKIFSDRPAGEKLKDKITGAWIGRIAGCLLGKPVEGYKRDKLWPLLKETNNYPMCKYIDSLIDKMVSNGYSPVDDDTNYSVFGMKLIEVYGKDFKPDDVLEAWLSWIPCFQTCTAERVAYRNAAAGLYAPQTATHKNPFREWIGAQIRADFFGYCSIGNLNEAVSMAFRDASISHIKNGIYGEMFIAALIAAAAVCDDMQAAIDAALCEIPKNCRLRRDIDLVITWHKTGVSEDEAIEKIHQSYDEKSAAGWCYTNSNAMIVVMALLYGKKNFGKTICLAVQSAFDTDCNGATTGSVLGIMLGAKNIDPYWPKKFNYALKTSVDGYEKVTVDQLAEKTISLI